MFHLHCWVEVRRTFNTPTEHLRDFKGTNSTAERILFGFTNIELRCEVCGDVKFVQTNGESKCRE